MNSQFDPNYETTRVADAGRFEKKLRLKRFLARTVGEVYIGKRVKLAYFRRWLRKLNLKDGANILEVGSGDGVFAYAAAESLPNCSVVGMELNLAESVACERVARREKLDNLRFVGGILIDFGWIENFDLIFCLDVLEHISDDAQVLREMHAALKPGANLLIHVPNRFFKDIDGSMHTIADEDAWKVNPGHVRNGYTVDELSEKLLEAGLAVDTIEQTQGKPIARAHRLYRKIERFLPARVAVLPLMEFLIRQDLKEIPAHGNTLWALARKPEMSRLTEPASTDSSGGTAA